MAGFMLICGLLLFGVAPVSNAEIYRWVDENGKVHFSDRKDERIEQEVVRLKTTPSNWQRFEINVEAQGVELSVGEIAGIADSVNHVYEFYDRILHFNIHDTVPVNVLIVENHDAYRRYLVQRNLGHLISSYGIYLPANHQIVVYLRGDRQGTMRTITHEVSHAVLDTLVPFAPAWLNEGLAEVMETIDRDADGLFVRPHPSNDKIVTRAFNRGQLRDIDDLLKLPSEDWRHSLTSGQSFMQAQAGQFLYFLLSKPTGRSFVSRLMHNFDCGDRTLSYYLIDDNYVGGMNMLNLSWNKWLHTQSKDPIRF